MASVHLSGKPCEASVLPSSSVIIASVFLTVYVPDFYLSVLLQSPKSTVRQPIPDAIEPSTAHTAVEELIQFAEGPTQEVLLHFLPQSLASKPSILFMQSVEHACSVTISSARAVASLPRGLKAQNVPDCHPVA